MARQIQGEHVAAVMGEPARLQRPDRVIHPRAVQEDDSGCAGSSSFPPVEAKTSRPDAISRYSAARRGSAFLRRAQRLGEIGDDVVRLLEADREPDHVLADPGGRQLRRIIC